MHKLEKGQIFVNGNEEKIDDPSVAIKLGIGMVHQHFMLVPHLSVSENIILGQEPTSKRIFLDTKKIKKNLSIFCEK